MLMCSYHAPMQTEIQLDIVRDKDYSVRTI
jgi:hypothetical protein